MPILYISITLSNDWVLNINSINYIQSCLYYVHVPEIYFQGEKFNATDVMLPYRTKV